MKIIYRSFDGLEFNSEQSCLKYEKYVLKMKNIFDKMVDENFFENYKIPMFYHNKNHDNLGKPSKHNFDTTKRGYIIAHGQLGNVNTWITFKLRKNKLLIFKEDPDFDNKWEQKRYYGCVDITKYLDVVEVRKIKIQKIVEKLQN